MTTQGYAKSFAALAAASAIFIANPLNAAEIRLLSAASMQTVLKEIVGDFERVSGHTVVIHYATMGAITQRVIGGEEADLVISSPASIARLVREHRISAGSEIAISRTGVGAVVPAGDVTPRIASIDDFRQALLAARVIVYANPAGGGAAGIHIARMIDKLGIAEAMKAKTKLAAGGDVTEVALAEGAGALGLTQVSEIVGKPDAQFVPLPEEIQNYTGFIAGTPTRSTPSEAVAAFIRFLQTPAAISVMKAKGMQSS